MRWRLTLSYAGVVVLTGTLLLAVVWVFLLRYVPDGPIDTGGPFVPNRSDLIRAFVPPACAALVGLLVAGLVGGWLLAGRMLAPLDRITAAARLVSSGSLSHRIRLEGPRDELRELADVLDAMLERLEAHVAEQGRFAANASHELRTPLAISRTLLEVARDDPERDVGALLDRLDAVNARAIDLTEAMLALSVADGRAFERERVDLSLVAEDAVETLAPIAARRGVRLEVDPAAASAIGSPSLLTQMATNLVHNAIVHNLRQDGTVHVHVGEHAGATTLVVASTGAVISRERVATLAEPFQRGAARARSADDHVGVGLGLAIVHGIVRAHDGSLLLEPREGGGLVVTVRLPAPPV